MFENCDYIKFLKQGIQKRKGFTIFPQHILKLNVVLGIKVQNIHFVLLAYSIKFQHLERNVSNVYTFDEHYRYDR